MNTTVKLLEIVALVVELPDKKLVKGRVSAVVELLAPDVFEVEFSDGEGQTYAMLPLPSEQLLVLHYAPT